MDETDTNEVIVTAQVAGWLDESSRLPEETEKLLRIIKLTEETGEIIQAVIGMLPQASRNPNDGRGGQGPFEMADLRV